MERSATVDSVLPGLGDARTLLESFGEIVLMARCEHGVSMRELGDRLGIPFQSLSKIENGVQMPSADEAQLLADWVSQHPVGLAHADTHDLSCREHQRRHRHRSPQPPTPGA